MKKTIHGNAEKKAIAIDMLERYTGHQLKKFEKQIIITNFSFYLEIWKNEKQKQI